MASHWRGGDRPRDEDRAALADDFGRFLARAGAEQRFTLSCMAFQDALSLDEERVRGCCIHVVRPDGRMIPFGLHNLKMCIRDRACPCRTRRLPSARGMTKRGPCPPASRGPHEHFHELPERAA